MADTSRDLRRVALSTLEAVTLRPRDLSTRPESARFPNLACATLRTFDDLGSPEQRRGMLRQIAGLSPTLKDLRLVEHHDAPDGPLVSDPFSEAHVATLCAALPGLERLCIEEQQHLSGAVLDPIGRLPELKHLLVELNTFSGTDLSRIGNLSRLVDLSIYFDRYDSPNPALLEPLRDATHLRSLTLHWSARGPHPVTEDEFRLARAHLGPLSGLTGLTALDLTNLPVDDAALELLAPLTELRTLGLAVDHFGDDPPRLDGEGLRHLGGMQQLGALRLAGNFLLRDEHLRHLSRLALLRHLDLSSTLIQGNGFLQPWGPWQLESLDLRNCTAISTEGLEAISRLRSLKEIDLSIQFDGDAQVESDLQQLCSLPALERLTLVGRNHQGAVLDQPTASALLALLERSGCTIRTQ